MELKSGELLSADLALIGIGVLPNTSLAEGAGLSTDRGILVDERGRTSAPDVWAAGDCAAFPLNGEIVRLKSVQNAVGQAESVADDMLGKGRPYRPVPWFWSDQYDAKLQIAGLSRGHTHVVKRRSAAGEAHWYFKGERSMAVDAINDARSFMTARKLLPANIPVNAQSLADSDFDLRTLLA